MAADILHAIRSGRDLWLFDQVVEGPDRLERACNLLIERRAACSDPDEAAFLTTVIRGLEKGDDDDAPKARRFQHAGPRRRTRKCRGDCDKSDDCRHMFHRDTGGYV